MTDVKAEFEFESALTELEQLVNHMESGELSLEDSLKAFEQGVNLTRQCQQSLAAAEQRVQLLIEQSGQSVGQPFVTGDERG
ncbi:exodeoxyribonuclease VII small subunit [Thalassolituus sp.]|jgi:exodeoxyribonuclease VII small subunit|uniref:exodeoxyribonuclease VII small subunit n=1 Tax=Thalassolituus sp. TaxID=2030822 RepID=UPI002A7F726B|nr:exodeoxyribonuclease VII small subunit [Thalassolituus sp.]|tara:strand:+ start:669 stop:914 length:246 start_codon:yes stop_codon:yes gene_type:complete